MCSRSAARRKLNVSATAMNRLNWRRSISDTFRVPLDH